jgi:hypothetical protein
MENISPEMIKFLSQYDHEIMENALKLRQLILTTLPEITEQIDIPAKMIAYCYGQKYSELICVIIPSKKGLKLGFNRGTKLPDPNKLLQGTGKVSRYVEINPGIKMNNSEIKDLLTRALKLYKEK